MSSSPVDPVVIPLPLPYAVGTVNAYLLPGDPLTLIDPGPNWPPALAALEGGLLRHGLRLEDIELVALTHQHDDHTGLAQTVRERAGCPVAAHEVVVGLLRDEQRSRAAEEQYSLALLRLHGVPAERLEAMRDPAAAVPHYAASVVIDRPLGDGDVLTAGGRDLVVTLRPGHSPTDTVFTAADAVAFVGDHLLLDGPVVTVAHRPPRGSADPRARRSALLDYRGSLACTLRDDLQMAHPGHGPAIENPGPLMAQRLREQERRADRLLARLGRSAQTAWDIVTTRGNGRPSDDANRPVTTELLLLSNVLASLDLLVARGRVREIDAGDVLRYSPRGR